MFDCLWRLLRLFTAFTAFYCFLQVFTAFTFLRFLRFWRAVLPLAARGGLCQLLLIPWIVQASPNLRLLPAPDGFELLLAAFNVFHTFYSLHIFHKSHDFAIYLCYCQVLFANHYVFDVPLHFPMFLTIFNVLFICYVFHIIQIVTLFHVPYTCCTPSTLPSACYCPNDF